MSTVVPVVKDALLNSTTINKQIAALYLYYALFHKQPLHQFVRMRITSEDSRKLHQFSRLLKAKPTQFGQPLLILAKLWSDTGFLLVAEDEECLRILYRGVLVNESERGRMRADFEPLNLRMEMEDVFDVEEGLLTRIEILEVAYNEMKEVLAPNEDDPNMRTSNICSTVTGQLNRVASLLNKDTQFSSSREVVEEQQRQVTMTGRERVLNKISAIQRSKNTLPVEQNLMSASAPKRYRADPTVVVVSEDEEQIRIDTSFMSLPQEKRKESYAQQVANDQEDQEKKKNYNKTLALAIKRAKRK